MVRTQIAQQASNNLYAQLQNYQQTINSHIAQTAANNASEIQNKADDAMNSGAFGIHS